MDDELEQMMAEAMKEVEELDDDTTQDENQQEESASEPNDTTEDEDNREDFREDETNDDQEDDELDDEENYEDNQGDNDDTSDGENNNNEENSSSFDPIEVEVNGQTISLDNKEELLAFIKSKNTPQQRQRKTEIEQIAEQGKLSQEDLTLLIDAKNGNKAAIAKLAKQSNIDVYDIDDELADKYQQEFQPRIASEVDEVAEDILADEPLHQEFQKVITSVPKDFAAGLATDAKALRHFADHVKSGLAQEVIPAAIKAQLLEGGDFITHYAKIGREMSEAKKAPEKSKTKRKTNPRADKLKERAKNHKGSSKGTKTSTTGEDIWNMSSEDFNKKYM